MKRQGQGRRCHAESLRAVRFASRPGGFSLLELLVVIALILILMTMYWSGFGRSSRGKSQFISCQRNLQKIQIAMQIYANDSAGKFPVTTNARTSEEPLDLLVPRYTVDTTLFLCPGSKTSALAEGQTLRQGKISYAYYMGRRSSDVSQALMSDVPGNHQKLGGNSLFCDGRVEQTSASTPASSALPDGIVLLNPKP